MIEIKTAGLDEFLEGGSAKQRFLILGIPGSGKTPFAAQFPKPIFLMADRNGPDSLVLTGTPYIEIRSEKDAHEAIDALTVASMKPNRKYETVVLDTFSVLQRHVLQEILRREGKSNIDDFRQWGELTAIMAKILHRLHNLDMHVVVTVHTKDKFDAEGELELDLIGGMKSDLAKEFPNIGWLHTEWGIKQVNGEDTKVVQRSIGWRATPKVPLLRSTAALLPESTPVAFVPEDYLVLERAFQAGAKALGATASVAEVIQTEVEQKAAPADLKGGPVEPDASALPKARAQKGAPAKKAEPKPAAKAEPAPAADPTIEAIAAVEQTLGGEVIADGDPIVQAIEAVTDPADFKVLWQKHSAEWTAEHTALVKTRQAGLAKAAKANQA